MIAHSYIRPGIFRRPKVTDWLTFVATLIFSVGALGLMMLLPERPYIAIAPFAGVAIMTLLWRRPAVSVFILFWMTTVIEQLDQHFPDSLTDRIPLWRNLSSSGLSGVKISPAELLMIAGIAIWCLRGLFSQTLETQRSPLLGSYRRYLIVVIIGIVHGITTGGNSQTVLWEIRSLFYAAIAFFMALNLIQSRRQMDALGWIIILGTGFKGLQGTWRYLVTFHGAFEGNEMMEHEEAFFFPAYYVFLLLLFIFGGSRRLKLVGLSLLPFVIIAEIGNNRRASTGAFAICMVALVFILYTLLVHHRLRILRGTLVAIVFLTFYAGAFWNSNSSLGKPVRALKSQIAPDDRDRDSDLYRELENQSLMRGIWANALVGRGYGTEMELLPGMVDVRATSPFMLSMPHNSVLWIWWRTGLVGFALFWMACGLAIIRNCFLARAVEDPYIRRWAVFAICVTIMGLLVGWWDQGIFSNRMTVYIWTILAVPEILRRSIGEATLARAITGDKQ